MFYRNGKLKQARADMTVFRLKQLASTSFHAAADAMQKTYRGGDTEKFRESSATFLATVERVSGGWD